MSAGGHNQINFEKVGELNGEDSFYYITKQKDIISIQGVEHIQKQLNHKTITQMEYVFRSAGKLDYEIKKLRKPPLNQDWI